MLRSMYSAVSGLQAFQEMMDVVGNNIANVDTVGFKASRVEFEDTLSQVVSGATSPTANSGGVNPQQIGLGVRVGSVDMTTTQGAIQTTGRPTDLAIQGSGYFVVSNGAQQLYTRAGSFGVDSAGNLVDPTGAIVQGWIADPTGKISTNGPAGNLTLPVGSAIAPNPTSTVNLGGNLSADDAVGDAVTSTITVYDGQGTAHSMTVTMTKTASDTWQVSASDNGGAAQAGPALTFDANGNLTSTAVPTFTITAADGTTSTVTLNLGTPGTANALTQFGGDTTAIAESQDGTPSGYMTSFAIGTDGTISGTFSNGTTRNLGQIAIATFNNPAGLMQQGDGHFTTTGASGNPVITAPGQGQAGTLDPGALEQSNVDLSQEFTNLIVAQRGFEANSRVITTGDQLLQALVNLKQ
ncbi:MAG TPA: flagellar hook protein FlgE [Mycobacteriales bacterium]|nr:flagellar hook protein FlgE [Mycobacteriales bacterium]